MTQESSSSPNLPEELRQLHQSLQQVRFEPPESFGVELEGRLRRGEQPAFGHPGRARILLPRPLLVGIAGLLALWMLVPEGPITVDRCCYDLDGGGIADDGALVVGERDGRVTRLSLYEDRDGSGSFTAPDILRYDRIGTPNPAQQPGLGQTTIDHCCQDLDGGGPADDGLVVRVTPPDRVHTAAIYQLR